MHLVDLCHAQPFVILGEEPLEVVHGLAQGPNVRDQLSKTSNAMFRLSDVTTGLFKAVLVPGLIHAVQ